MKKALGLALALVFSLSMAAAAEQAKGIVKSVDPANQSFTLEDGTTLSVSSGAVTDLAPGEKVEAVYEIQGGKKIVTGMDRRVSGTGIETSNLSGYGSYKIPGVVEEGVGD